MNSLRIRIALILCTALTSINIEAQTLYRYMNDEGVKVINSSLPSEYSQNGYEIINASGEVLKRVPAAPSADDVDKANREREILNTYNVLKRRYSDVSDIERAKMRRLQNIDTSISILKGSINNLDDRINELLSRAAVQERAGRQVPEIILKQLESTRSELAISKDLLKYRENEFVETSKKFDEDMKAYVKGDTLAKALSAETDPGER